MRRAGIGTLIAGWCVYWAALAAGKLGPLLTAANAVSRSGHGHGSASLGVNNLRLTASVVLDGVTTYTGSSHVVAVALWLAGPPLLMWGAWLAFPRHSLPPSVDTDAAQLAEGDDPAFAARRAAEKQPMHRTPV